MKLNDVDVFVKDGRLVIGTKNKRGQLKSCCKDVTKTILDFIIKKIETEENKYKIYEKDGKIYKIECQEMIEEEIEAMNKNDEKEKNKSLAKISSLYSTILYDNPMVHRLFDMSKEMQPNNSKFIK